jgi:hypothetical protein
MGDLLQFVEQNSTLFCFGWRVFVVMARFFLKGDRLVYGWL